MFELFLLPPARRFLDSLNRADQLEVLGLLSRLSEDPFWDYVTKFPFAVPPVVVSMYDSGRFRIVYHVVGSIRIRIWAIAFSEESPEIH